MSSSPAEAAFVTETQQYLIANYCTYASSVLIIYEHIVTLDREIEYIWKYRLSATTCLLLFNRLILLSFACSEIACYAQTLVQYLSVMLLDIATAVFSSLRVYAITGRKWQFAVVTLALGIPSAGAEIYYASTVTDVDDGRVGDILICSYNFAGTGISNYFRASLTSSVCAVTSDLIVVLATWMYTTGWRNHLKQSGVQASLIATLLMDGTMYFLVFLALNVVMLVLDFAPFLQSLDGAGNGYSTAFRIVIPNIMMSRFILNLRHASAICQHDVDINRDEPATSFSESQLQTSLHFASGTVGNMGAPLDHSISNGLTTNGDGLEELEFHNENIECIELSNQTHYLGTQGSCDTGL